VAERAGSRAPRNEPQPGRPPEDQPPQEANRANESCGAPKSSLTQPPIERINDVLHPTGSNLTSLLMTGFNRTHPQWERIFR
jgi:hypothetical protein